jgi:hypothetical protein
MKTWGSHNTADSMRGGERGLSRLTVPFADGAIPIAWAISDSLRPSHTPADESTDHDSDAWFSDVSALATSPGLELQTVKLAKFRS